MTREQLLAAADIEGERLARARNLREGILFMVALVMGTALFGAVLFL